MRLIVFLVLALVLFSYTSDAGAAAKKDYRKIGDCSKKASMTCTYKYSVDGEVKGGEDTHITANVDIFCESVGDFKKEPAIRYCINVRDAVGRISNKENKYNSDTEAPIKHLDKFFCFAQSTSSGKVLGIFHPKSEKEWVVNIKRSIASAFQANYKETAVANETDSQSKHKSHYKYFSEGNKQIQERRIDSRDVSVYAGKASIEDRKGTLYFHEHDKLEIDSERRIQFSEGKSVLELGAEEEDKATASDTNDKAVPPLGAISDYKLRLSRCYKPPRKDLVEELTTVMASSECAVGDILATIDEVEVDAEAMEELSNELPSFDETVKRIQRDTESEEAIQLVDKWRKLLKLESKNGALSGTKEKLPQLLQRLNEIEMDEESRDERVLIYHLLSSVGNLESQKALLDMLKVHSSSSLEATSLLVEIALMPSVHSSTVDSLISQYESLKSNDYVANQLILSLGTLGRHSNVEDKIVKYLSVKLMSAMTPEETSILIHALGNTASKKIIPILEPFISDDTYQSYTIDALRGVSMDGAVQKEFTTLVTESLHPQVVLEVVESLTFPFKNSLYSFKIKKDYDASQDLKSALIRAAIKYKEDELMNSLKEYFTAINDKTSKEILQKGLESNNVPAGHQKRATTSRNWSSSSNRNYNLIESLAQRRRDIHNFPFNKGFLWATQIGAPKVHAKVAAGGFGGIGISGIKLFARARVDLVAWSKSYTALDVFFLYLAKFPDKNSKSTLTVRQYIKIVGTTLLNRHFTNSTVLRYSHSWYKRIKLFEVGYSFWIYVGFLRLSLSSYISGHLTFQAYVAPMNEGKDMKAAAGLIAGPTLTVRGEAAINILLIFKIGMGVTASLSYHITPEASTTVCDTSPKGDANACFEVYSITTGRIYLKAFWQKRKTKCYWKWGPRCKIYWSGRKTFRPLSKTWNLFSRKKKLFGVCRVCECYGNHFLNVICHGNKSGSSTCACRTQISRG